MHNKITMRGKSRNEAMARISSGMAHPQLECSALLCYFSVRSVTIEDDTPRGSRCRTPRTSARLV